MRYSPVAGAPPSEPKHKPKPHALKPFTRLLPANTPTMLKPSKVSINNSAEPNAKITGRAISTNSVKIMAPKRPPNNDEANAAESARAA